MAGCNGRKYLCIEKIQYCRETPRIAYPAKAEPMGKIHVRVLGCETTAEPKLILHSQIFHINRSMPIFIYTR